jgi:plasmid maintenance system antidote protein VapI
MLQALLDRASLSQGRFAAAVGHPTPFINQIIHGHRTPPLDNLDRWAAVVGVSDERELRVFLRLASVAHLPAEARQHFVDLVLEHEQLLDRVTALAKRVDELGR